MVAVAQLVRAPDCGSGGCGFNPRQPPCETSCKVAQTAKLQSGHKWKSPALLFNWNWELEAHLATSFLCNCATSSQRSVAQLVEHRSPKPGVAGSIPAGPV